VESFLNNRSSGQVERTDRDAPPPNSGPNTNDLVDRNQNLLQELASRLYDLSARLVGPEKGIDGAEPAPPAVTINQRLAIQGRILTFAHECLTKIGSSLGTNV
jgi:hypothetical protein